MRLVAADEILFPPFRFDLTGERLWRGRAEIRLRAKTFAVLRSLAQRPGQLVTREALLETHWPGIAVEDGSLTACLREIRRALDEDPRQPRFIETVHKRGYRWIATAPSEAVSGDTRSSLVGRDAELLRLRVLLGDAEGGQRRWRS